MTTFDEREKAYEAKFARDQDLRFRATARRNRLLGQWAAAQLGIPAAEVDAYAQAVVRADFQVPGDSDVIEKVMGDFKERGIPLTEADLQKKLSEFMAQAVAQIESGK